MMSCFKFGELCWSYLSHWCYDIAEIQASFSTFYLFLCNTR